MKICLACNHRFEAADWHCPACRQAPPRAEGAWLFAPNLAGSNHGFRAEYFQQLAGVEPDHFWFRNRNRLLIWAMRTYFPEAQHFLEVGCGTGFVLSALQRAFPKLRVFGSELFLEGLSFARKRLPGIDLYQMDAEQLPFEAEFDVIGAFDVLEHIEADEAVLRQLHQAVKPGGGLLLTVPQHPALWSAADVRACHRRRYTRDELLQKLAAAGFKPLRVTSFVTVLLPALWAARRRRGASESLATDAEYRLSPGLNAWFERLLRVENWVIRQGGSPPVGGSLLVAAQRSK